MPFLTPLQGRFQDGPRFFVLTDELAYVSNAGAQFIVPRGFACDLASVPKWAAAFAAPWNLSAEPGCLHDWLYQTATLSREGADAIFREALLSRGVDADVARRMWEAVRVFGLLPWIHWRAVAARAKEPT